MSNEKKIKTAYYKYAKNTRYPVSYEEFSDEYRSAHKMKNHKDKHRKSKHEIWD